MPQPTPLPTRPRTEHNDRPMATSVTAAVERLRLLLHTAAALDLDDGYGWWRLRDTARSTLSDMAVHGLVPAPLAVIDDDPPVVVSRLLTVAWRRATAASGHQEHAA